MRDKQSHAMQAFRAAYEANVGSVYRFLISRLGNREEAEDLTSQVFTKAIHSADWMRDPAEIHQWLMQVTRTTLADYWRTALRLRTTSLEDLLAEGWQGPAALQETDDEVPQNTVAALLEGLPPRYHEVLRYRFLLGYSIRETAAALGVTESNAKILQMRALQRAAATHDYVPKAGVTAHEES